MALSGFEYPRTWMNCFVTSNGLRNVEANDSATMAAPISQTVYSSGRSFVDDLSAFFVLS